MSCMLHFLLILECNLTNCLYCDGVPAKCDKCDVNYVLNTDGDCGECDDVIMMSLSYLYNK